MTLQLSLPVAGIYLSPRLDPNPARILMKMWTENPDAAPH